MVIGLCGTFRRFTTVETRSARKISLSFVELERLSWTSSLGTCDRLSVAWQSGYGRTYRAAEQLTYSFDDTAYLTLVLYQTHDSYFNRLRCDVAMLT